jgi:hypothetical protein
MGEVYAAIQRGGRAACSGGGGSLMTHSTGSVTTPKKALKYVMASEPYRYNWYFKQVMASLPYIEIYFFLNTYNIENKKFLSLT